MKDIKYEVRVGKLSEWNSKGSGASQRGYTPQKSNEIKKYNHFYFGVSDSFKPFDKTTNHYWSYEDRFFDGNTDLRRREEGYNSRKNPLIPYDRVKNLKYKTFDDIILEKRRKGNLDIELLLLYKKDEIEKELKEFNSNISKFNDGVFLWKHVISHFVIPKIVNKSELDDGGYNSNVYSVGRVNQSSISIFDKYDEKRSRSVYKTLCTYKKNDNEYIFDFGHIPNEHIKNDFCYKINGIIYRSKNHEYEDLLNNDNSSQILSPKESELLQMLVAQKGRTVTTFEDLVLKKSKKTNLDIDTILLYKKEEIIKQLNDINLEISKVDDFLWDNLIGLIVQSKFNAGVYRDRLHILHTLISDDAKYKELHTNEFGVTSWGHRTIISAYKVFLTKIPNPTHDDVFRGIDMKPLCTYPPYKQGLDYIWNGDLSEYIFDFIDNIPNKHIKNEFCYKINGIIYRSKNYKKPLN